MLVPAVGFLLLGVPVAALGCATLAGGLALFFRDPDRVVPQARGLVVSPADGRVIHAGPADVTAAPDGEWLQVSVFLSPLDVHVNRTPIGGRVEAVDYRPGQFFPAYRSEAGRENERSQIRIEDEGHTVIVRQVVGVLARRVVCRLTPGMKIQRGDRLGIMKFGSRMDVFLPVDAVLQVAVQERVRGGESVIAELRPTEQPNAG